MENFQAKETSDVKPVDTRLEDIVNRMFQRCFEDKKFKQAIGIAIETRRLDIVEKAILTSVMHKNYLIFFPDFYLTNIKIVDKRFRNDFVCIQNNFIVNSEQKVSKRHIKVIS